MLRKALVLALVALFVFAFGATAAVGAPLFSYMDAKTATPDVADATGRADGYCTSTGASVNIAVVGAGTSVPTLVVTPADLNVGLLVVTGQVYGAFVPAALTDVSSVSASIVPQTVYAEKDGSRYNLYSDSGLTNLVGRLAPFGTLDVPDGTQLTLQDLAWDATNKYTSVVAFDAGSNYVATVAVKDGSGNNVRVAAISPATRSLKFTSVSLSSNNTFAVTASVDSRLKSAGVPVTLSASAYDSQNEPLVSTNPTVTVTLYALKGQSTEVYNQLNSGYGDPGDVWSFTFTGLAALKDSVKSTVQVYAKEDTSEGLAQTFSNPSGDTISLYRMLAAASVSLKVVGTDGVVLRDYKTDVLAPTPPTTPGLASKVEVSAESITAAYGAKATPAVKVRVVDKDGKPKRSSTDYVYIKVTADDPTLSLPTVQARPVGASSWSGTGVSLSTTEWDGSYQLSKTNSDGWFELRIGDGSALVGAGTYTVQLTYSFDGTKYATLPNVSKSVVFVVPAKKLAEPPAGYTGAKVLKLYFGTNYYEADGKPGAWAIDLGMPYLDLATNRTYVPVRAVANLFGVSNDQITWSFSPEGKLTVVITTPFGRTITIDQNTNTISYSGNASGTITLDTAAIQLKNGRTYVPFRFLAYAFGLTGNQVSWGGDWVQFDWTALP